MKRPPAGQGALEELLEDLEEQEMQKPAPALPAGAPLAAVLQLRQRHSDGELAAAGLAEAVAAAERRRDTLLAEAARQLQPLGVSLAELRRLADRAVARWTVPPGGAGVPACPADTDLAGGLESPASRSTTREGEASAEPPGASKGTWEGEAGKPAPPVVELCALLERAREVGRRAGRESGDRLRRQLSPDAEPEPAAGAVLLLDVEPESALGEALREVGADPPPGMRLAVGTGAGCMLELGELSPHRERRIQEAAAEAALATLREALAVEGCVRVYEP
jgi:hypothetical protein